MGIYKKLSWFFKDKWKSYFIAIIALLFVAILQLIPPRIIGVVIDEIATDVITTNSLMRWLVILVLTAVAQYALRYVWRVNIWGNAQRLEKIMRNRLYKHFTEMDSEFYQKYRTGDLMAHATNDLRALRMVAGGGIVTMADSLSITVITITAMFVVVDWRLTLLAIIPLPFLAVASRYLGRMLHTRFRGAQDAFSQMNNKVQESLQGIKRIKTFGQEKEDIEEFHEQTDNIVAKNREVYKIDSLFDPVLDLIIGSSYVIAIIVGGHLILDMEISVGEFVTFISYIGMLVWPMFAIGRLFNIIERGSASYERIELLLSEKSAIVERKGAANEPPAGDIEFKVDSFKYPNSEEVALKDVSFNIKKGNTLGIVGKTGAGKTSILKLLLRDYDHYDGEIKFGDNDIRNYTLDALLQSIGYVPQDTFLFSTSIRDNIRFSDPTLSQEKVEIAAKISDIHDDIVSMPNGYDTQTGERGVSLSGGQKQRVSIARALIKNPELMILDDSLSAVDAKTEEEILRGLKELREDQTTIIVAHRISSLMHADEIIVLDEGKITERGTHEELIEQNGWYNEMYNKQQLEQKIPELGEEGE
ncbi:ATP-binding cassette, subfamily B [Atopostipes suicloacalis DSM 15692]|uniref:ATP-binding cassette, subfamily B n=1 Tax=Atopostipes suicloacalis DSM 15692 TaxID=1121025 RepID=A0A1M4TFU0_9LACT|nr:ABC transporter transmembrane domain-containing protein [Atopostipes suicloacalis]SHE43204.1 ATP-binding cassette, subfamily B [Atopostipes suicloacalis DSM 15692]